jgi:hypothetical protein
MGKLGSGGLSSRLLRAIDLDLVLFHQSVVIVVVFPVELLLLSNRLRRYYLRQALEPWSLEDYVSQLANATFSRGWVIGHTGRGVRLERRDDSRLGNLVRTTVVHINGLQQQHVALLGYARGHGLHDLAVDGLLVVGHEVLVQQLLDLVGREPGPRCQLPSYEIPQYKATYIQQISWMISMSFSVAFFSCRSLVAC